MSQQNILVVDDEAVARRFMERALTEAGYRVMLANDGEQALEVIRMTRRRIALVITDLVMPGMGGHAFALAKRFLQKPFSTDQLVTAVRTLISPPQEVGS
jgi:CheY-like chemotaxis protein